MRKDRNLNELRKVEFITNFSQYAEGSCLVKFGNTQVLCNASLDPVSYTHLTLPTTNSV